MSRNGSGVFTLVAGNPVTSGTTISSTWANDTLDDIATEITASLDRNGKGGMLAALRGIDGSVSAPTLSWTSETNSGWYRASAGNCRFAILGSDIITVTGSGVSITGTFTASGTITIATADINGGAIDGTIVGAASAAAATVTDLTATGTITFTGATVADGGTVTTIDIDGGTIDGAVIGGASAAAATFTDLTATGTITFTGATIADAGTVTTMDLNGGTIDGTVIGGSSAAAGTFTTVTGTTVKGTVFHETAVAIAASAIDCSLGNAFHKTLSANTTFTFSNVPSSVMFGITVEITQDSTARTITWPAAVKWNGGSAPSAPAINDVAIYTMYTRDGGTTWYGFEGGSDMS